MKEEQVKETSIGLLIGKLRVIEETQRMLILTISETLDSYKKLETESWLNQGTPLANIETSEDLVFQLLDKLQFHNDCLLEIKNRVNEIF